MPIRQLRERLGMSMAELADGGKRVKHYQLPAGWVLWLMRCIAPLILCMAGEVIRISRMPANSYIQFISTRRR